MGQPEGHDRAEESVVTAPAAGVRKRSIDIAGHRTSVSLEEPFWDALKAIAAAEGVSLRALIVRVDADRGDTADGNLSSALRLYALAHLRRRAGL